MSEDRSLYRQPIEHVFALPSTGRADAVTTACQAAPPNPVDLGEYLADLIIADNYGLAPDPRDYTALLGDAGTTAIREYVAAVYKATPEQWNVRNLMKSLLKTEGDIDALDWAERGVGKASRPDGKLIDYVVARYSAAGRQADVLELRRSAFQNERSLANYQTLRQAAIDSGTWQAERPKALAELGEDAKVRPAWSWNGPGSSKRCLTTVTSTPRGPLRTAVPPRISGSG